MIQGSIQIFKSVRIIVRVEAPQNGIIPVHVGILDRA